MGAPSQLFRNRNLPRCTGVEPVLMRHAILYREKTRTISRYGRARLCRKNKKPSGLARSVGTNLVHQKAASNWEGERPTGVQNRPVSGGISATQPHKGNRIIRILERAMGIEPTSEAWEAPVLPLYDARSLFLIVLKNWCSVQRLSESCLSTIILSPLNGNVKMSPYETGDIHVESEGTAASERNYCLRQGRHGVCQRRRTPGPERAPD